MNRHDISNVSSSREALATLEQKIIRSELENENKTTVFSFPSSVLIFSVVSWRSYKQQVWGK